MKRYFGIFVALFVATSLYAQTNVSLVKGSLVDSYYKEGVVGAVVELVSLDSKREPVLTTSGYDGAFTFQSMPYGAYILKATFMGYQDFADTVKIDSPRALLGKFSIKESSTKIDAVVKEVAALRTSQRGDTLSYNASSYKVANDADVEGLLKKMPGVTVTDGEVSAQGESIKKIFVDGKEFFGNDVTTAISSLPAEIVESIEVYDKLSDNAELSGMDDGEGFKAINIVTRPGMNQGFFGKLYAGGGYQPEVEGDFRNEKYMLGGNVNYFTGSHRFTLLGMLNNINQQSFSFDDILGVSASNAGGKRGMVRPQSGIADVGALGLNYSGSFGANDKVKVEGSYFYNGTDTKNYSTSDTWYEDPLAIDTLHTSVVSSVPNYNHRLTGRVDWKITPSQQITLRQNASFQFNDAESTTLGSMYGESGYSLLDSYNLSDKSGYNSSTSLSYITRLGKNGRTISANGGLDLNKQDNIVYSYSNAAEGYTFGPVIAADTALLWDMYPDQLLDIGYKTEFSPTSTVTLRGNLTYAEPIGEFTRLMLKYNYSNKRQDTDKSTYNTDSTYEIFEDNLLAASSNSYNSTYVTHQVGPGFYYINGKSKLMLSLNYQQSELTGNVVTAGTTSAEPISHKFENVTYAAMGQLFFNSTNSLRMNISSKTSDPWVGNLVDAYNLTNSQYISKGNPNLIPSYNNTVRMFFTRSNIERGSTFMFMCGMDNQQDYIGNHIVYGGSLSVDGVDYNPIQYSLPVNLEEDYWSLNTMMEYGFPINAIKSNFNIRGGVNYRLTPSMYGGTIMEDGSIDGGAVNNNESITYSANAVLGSNISENVDFTLSWNGTYSEAVNSAATKSEVNTYLSQTASAAMKFVFLGGFTFTGAVTYKEYTGITNDYRDSYVLCNAFIGKKIFKNKRGELNIGVNDLFNQNTSFSRSVGTGYTQNTYNSVIGRYYSVQLVYNLRSFGNNSVSDHDRRSFGGGGGRPPRPEF